jgi:uncharacterized protein involved in type VI secretion and phage assembly
VIRELSAFAVPPAWWSGAHLARVVSVEDPLGLSRVQVQLLGSDADNDAPIWARVAVPFAGDNYGAFLIPDVDQEVLVLFVAGDPRSPVVVGALWNGATGIPETIGGASVDRWTLTGKNGTRIAIVEAASGQEKVEIETPAGVKATLTDEAGGRITLEAAGHTITMDTQGVSIQAASKVSVSAGQVEVSAGQVSVDAGLSQFSGVVRCDTLVATTVVGSTYTPGAGSVW